LFLSYFPALDDIYKRLSQAKTDEERVKILTEGLELSQVEIQKLAEENAKLREQNEELIKQNRELAENRINIISLNKLEAEERELSALIEQAEIVLKIRK